MLYPRLSFGSLSPVQRRSWCILQPQPTGPPCVVNHWRLSHESILTPPACLTHFAWIVCEMGSMWPYCFVGCCFQDLFQAVYSILVWFLLYLDLRPGPKCHSKWCTGRKWHIPMAVRRRNRVGGNWLTKWDKLKILWYFHRLTHWKRVTSELHDSYFRLMTIKHVISKIEWAIKWALNYYITQLSLSPSGSCSRAGDRVIDMMW